MTASGDDPDDKVVVDPAELQPSGSPGVRATGARPEEPRHVLARGTREHIPYTPPPAAPAARSVPPRDLERDPVAVLRAWPHSTAQDQPKPRAQPVAPSPCQRRIEDKIVLAHLALDLYREIEELQVVAHRAQAPSDATEEPPHSAACSDPRCVTRIHMLHAALVEACLLVQRVAMTPQTDRADIEDRIFELLELLQH